MCFGNPYGDPWSLEIVENWISKLVDKGIKIISLSDTIGCANKESIGKLFQNLSNKYKEIVATPIFHPKVTPIRRTTKVCIVIGTG